MSGGILNVKDFGAKGDGISDDYDAIQKAINAALLTDSPAEVFFPTGHYIVKSTLNVTTVAKGLHLSGIGYASQITSNIDETNKAAIIINHQTESMIEITDLRINGYYSRGLQLGGPGSNVHISRCYITGATADPGLPIVGVPSIHVCAGVFVQGLSDVWIENNWIFGNGFWRDKKPFGYDIVKWADTSSKWSRIHVRYNKIIGNDTEVSVAIYDANDCDVVGNTIDQGNHGNGISNGYGILFYKSRSNPEKLYRNMITNNIVRNTAGIGIYLAGCSYSVIQGNIIENSVQNQTDVKLEAGAIGLFGGFNTVIGNTIRTSGKAGISFSGKQTIVEGNNIVGTTTNGIWIRGEVVDSCDGSIITSNSLYNVRKHGILVYPTAVNGLCIIGNSLNTGSEQGITAPVLPNYVLTNATIANNSISKFCGHSIAVMGDRIILSGNVVTEGGQNGIDCRASHSIVEGNIVHKCNMYGYNNAADFVQLRNNDLSGNILGGINISSGGASLSQSGNLS